MTAQINSATYDVSSNVLTVIGTDLVANDTIAVSKLTLSGEGGKSYTLTSANVVATSATTFSVTLNAADQVQVEQLLNKNGTSPINGSGYNIGAALGWNITQNAPADLTSNGISVTNAPVVSVFDLEAATGAVTGSNSSTVYQTHDGLSGTFGQPVRLKVVSDAGFITNTEFFDPPTEGVLSGSTSMWFDGNFATSWTFSLDNGFVFDFNSLKLHQDQNAGDVLVVTSSKGGQIVVTYPENQQLNITDYNIVSSASAADPSLFQGITSFTVTSAAGSTDGTNFIGAFDDVAMSNVRAPGPSVTAISASTANGSYKVDAGIAITVTFSEAVTVTGVPQLTLETGTIDRVATYTSGTGTNTLTFNYTVQTGDTSADLDYAATTALALNNGTIQATVGGATALLTLPAPGALGSLGANKGIVIDTTPPPAPSVPDLQNASDSGLNTDNITSVTTPTFIGTAEAGSSVTLYNGSTALGTATATGGTWSITASSALAQGTHSITAQATDAAGNVGAVSSGLSVTIDTTVPTPPGLSSTSVAVSSTGSNAAIATISATDTQAITYTLVTGDGTNDSNNALFNISGTQLRTSNALSAGTFKIYLAATDVAGNVSYSAQTITVASGPTVSDARISITGASGTGGAYKAGDTVTATWDNSAAGDNASGVTGVTVDFSGFGGGSAVTATQSNGIWTANYLIAAGSIDATNRNVSVTATNGNGPTTTADTTNATVDNQAPTVTAPNFGLTGATGTAGAYKVGDTLTVTWNNTPPGDNNTDTISSVSVDFSQFGGGSAVAATNSGGVWTATYLITAGSLDTTGRNVTITATDNAGNFTSRPGTANVAVDNMPPVVTDAKIGISGGSGTGGAYKTGDTVTATWDNRVSGDNNSDTLSGVTFDFSAFGGGAAVAATESNGIWTATYTIAAGALNLAANRNVSATVTDNAGNTTTTADTTNATVDNSAPAVTGVTSSTNNGAYKAVATVSIQVAFGENVTVTGTPTLALNTGASAVYASGSGTGTLTFTYTIAAGQNTADLDYANTGALSLAGGSILDAAGNNATLTLPALGAVGSLGINKNIAVDTSAPTTTVATLTFSGDTGSSLTDLVSAEGAQDLGGTLNDIFYVGERVEVSLDNGFSWTDATAAEGGLNWSLPGQSLTGSNTIKVRVSDAAGNHGPEFSKTYTIDSSAPTSNPAGGTPADNATSVATTGAITLPFNEPLDAAGSVLTSVELRNVATNTVVPATATINGSGQLVITPNASLTSGTAYYVNWGANALKDLAGNSVAAVADQTTYNFTTAADSSGGGGTTTPPPGQSTVDGTTVQTGTTTNSNGTTTTTTTVAPVPANRPEDASTANSQLADIPLAKVGGDTVLQIGLPVGVGVTSSETTGTNLTLREKLIGASQPLSLPADFSQLLQTGIDTFVPGVQDPSQVTVRTLTLTSSATSAPGQPITISGTSGTGEGDGTHPLRQEALVIDARQLPSGTVLKFDKVEFALVIGAVRIVGGEGANFVVGDGSAQFIVLGAGDDVLRGGAGKDVVGSKGGNDRLYGDEGNDKLVGGIGNDHLEGGVGNDILIGGSSDAGAWRFALGGDGNLHASYASGEPDLSELTQAQITGTWQGGIAIDPRLAMVYNQDYGRLETAALLFQGLTGKLPTLDFQNFLSTPEWTKDNLLQGAWNWYESTLPANLGTADKAKALITQTLGASMASAQNVGIAVDFLGQGGTWTQALDFLVHQPQVKNAITVQMAGGASQLNLIQASNFAEAGWSFDSGNDTLLGGAGNDVLVGGGGSDVLDGGEGTDMAVYFGTLQHYAFTLQTNATSGQQEVLVRHIPSGDLDTLRSVELLQVGGQAYRINTGALQQGQEYALAGHVAEVGAQEVMLMGVPAL